MRLWLRTNPRDIVQVRLLLNWALRHNPDNKVPRFWPLFICKHESVNMKSTSPGQGCKATNPWTSPTLLAQRLRRRRVKGSVHNHSAAACDGGDVPVLIMNSLECLCHGYPDIFMVSRGLTCCENICEEILRVMRCLLCHNIIRENQLWIGPLEFVTQGLRNCDILLHN